VKAIGGVVRDSTRLAINAFRVYRRDPLTFAGLGLLMFPIELIALIVSMRVEGFEDQQNILSLVGIPTFFVQFIATASVSLAVTNVLRQERTSFFAALDATFEQLGGVLETGFRMFGLLVASVFAAPALALFWLLRRDATIDGPRDWLLAIVPFALTVYLFARWAFAPQAVVLHGARGWAALDASADTVRTHWFRALAGIVAGFVAMFVVSNLAGPAAYLPEPGYAIVGGAVIALASPLYFITQTLLYYDLQGRKHHDVSPDRLTVAEPDVPGEGA
jgi:hypothetical protein